MSNTPIEQQRLSVDPIEQIERKIAQGNGVSGEELLCAIEWSENHQLDDRLRDIICKVSISAMRRRGRRNNCRGREDFALAELDARYPALLRKYRREAQRRRRLVAEGAVVPASERTPIEAAYREMLQGMKADFSNIDWLALRNKHSEWKNGRFHSSDNLIRKTPTSRLPGWRRSADRTGLHANSLLSGNLTGNFAISGLSRPIF
jgi:hypothetical protein